MFVRNNVPFVWDESGRCSCAHCINLNPFWFRQTIISVSSTEYAWPNKWIERRKKTKKKTVHRNSRVLLRFVWNSYWSTGRCRVCVAPNRHARYPEKSTSCLPLIPPSARFNTRVSHSNRNSSFQIDLMILHRIVYTMNQSCQAN